MSSYANFLAILKRLHTNLPAMALGKRVDLLSQLNPELKHQPATIQADQHLIDQLERMYSYDILTARPGAHYIRFRADNPTEVLDDGSSETVGKTKGKRRNPRTKFQPIAKETWEILVETRHALGPEVAICGESLIYRAGIGEKRDVAKPDYTPSAYVVPPCGDIATAAEMVQLLHMRLAQPSKTTPPIIIINDETDFWKHLLWDVVVDKTGDLARNLNHHGVYVARNVDAARALINQHGEAAKGKRPPSVFSIPPGSTLLVATKTNEKVIELQKLFAKSDVRVWRFDHLANFKNPSELSGTFSGNAEEKIAEARTALQETLEQDKAKLDRIIDRNQIDTDKIFILAEDSGLYLDDPDVLPFMAMPRFKAKDGKLHSWLQHLGIPDGTVFYSDQFPGVEFGPAVIGSRGERRFWDAVNIVLRLPEFQAFKKARAQARGQDDSTLFNITNASVLAITPWHIGTPEAKPPIAMFSATTNNTLLNEPRIHNGEVIYSAHYLVPVHQGPVDHPNDPRKTKGVPRPGDRTQADMGADFLAHYSARTYATQILQQACDMNESHRKIAGVVQTTVTEEPYRVRTLYSQSSPRELPQKVMLEDFGALQLNDHRWAEQAEQQIGECEAYVLLPREAESRAKSGMSQFQELFVFFSILVAKQLCPRDKDKPFLVVDPKGSWNGIIGLYDEMRKTGMVNDQQNTYIQRATDLAHARALLSEHRQNRFIGEHAIFPTPLPAVGESGKFNVAVFCSATAKNQHLKNDAKALGLQLGLKNFGVVYGAADREMMGAVREGVQEAHDRGASTALLGSSTRDIIHVESEDPRGVISSHRKLGGQYVEAKTIYQRMAYMFEAADAFTIIPGGAGTVQELMAVLMLKEADHPSVRGKPIILYNQPLELGGRRAQKEGFYTPLLRMLGPETCRNYDIRVCDSLEHTMQAIQAARQEALPQHGIPGTKVSDAVYYKHPRHVPMAKGP